MNIKRAAILLVKQGIGSSKRVTAACTQSLLRIRNNNKLHISATKSSKYFKTKIKMVHCIKCLNIVTISGTFKIEMGYLNKLFKQVLYYITKVARQKAIIKFRKKNLSFKSERNSNLWRRQLKFVIFLRAILPSENSRYKCTQIYQT